MSNLPAETPKMPEVVQMIVKGSNPGLPLPDLVSYYVLEKDRKLFLDQEVDSSVLGIERMILRWNMEDAGIPSDERKPIWIYLFSPGGDADCMWSLVDAIEASETPVYTVNLGVAASAAGIIFLAGRKRLMTRRSKLVIHEGSAVMSGDAVKVMDASESYKKQMKQMKDFILSRTGISATVLNKQRCHDWELSADYCLAHGVCEGVVNKMSEIM